jgi:hypothetical protein
MFDAPMASGLCLAQLDAAPSGAVRALMTREMSKVQRERAVKEYYDAQAVAMCLLDLSMPKNGRFTWQQHKHRR